MRTCQIIREGFTFTYSGKGKRHHSEHAGFNRRFTPVKWLGFSEYDDYGTVANGYSSVVGQAVKDLGYMYLRYLTLRLLQRCIYVLRLLESTRFECFDPGRMHYRR